MSRAAGKRRGQPLVVYGLLIGGWIVVRTALWDSPLPADMPSDSSLPRLAASGSDRPLGNAAGKRPSAEDESPAPETGAAEGSWRVDALRPVDRAPLLPVERRPLVPPMPGTMAADPGRQPLAANDEFADDVTASGHQLLWLAAMARLPVPRRLAEAVDARPAPSPWLPLARQRGQTRWSLDAWVFLREGSGAAPAGSGTRPSYGKSQQGAVLRYRLADANGREPSLYARYTRALAGARQTDLAAGLSTKPFGALPLWLHAEMRATRIGGVTDWRPAAFATTGVHREVPGRLQVRGYGQAGYVGGDYATAFVDGQLVADREVAKFDLGKLQGGSLRVGAGAWGGAQKGADRLDIGPSANILVPVADAPVRLSVDYRFRVLGEAEPDSGVAVTLSTGF